MSNPFDPNQPDRSGARDQPDYDAYRYPTGGEAPQSTPGSGPAYGSYGEQPAYPAQPAAAGYGGYSGYDGPSTWAVHEEKNGVAPWALGLAIISLILGVSVVGSGFAFLPGILALIVGIVALARGRKIAGPGSRTGMSVTAIILSLIAIALSVLFWVAAMLFFRDSGMIDCIPLSDETEQQVCIERSLDSYFGS